jgi:hypothetical protein
VTHNSNESLEFSTVVIQVSDDGARWYTLYDSAWEGTYVESSAGKEIKTSYTAQSHDGSGAIKDTPSSAFFDPKIMIWDNDEKIRAYICGELSTRPSKLVYKDGDVTINGSITTSGVIHTEGFTSPSGTIGIVAGTTLQYTNVTASDVTTTNAEVTGDLTVNRLHITGSMSGIDTGAGLASVVAEDARRLDDLVNILDTVSNVGVSVAFFTDAACTTPFTSYSEFGSSFTALKLYCKLAIDGNQYSLVGETIAITLTESWVSSGYTSSTGGTTMGYSSTLTVGSDHSITLPSRTTTQIGYDKTYKVSGSVPLKKALVYMNV